MRVAWFDRAAFAQPLRQAAVENRDLLGAESAQRPPHPRGGEQAGGIVDDEAHAVAQAQRRHLVGELHLVGQHVRQAGRRVGDRVDVEEHRAGDVAEAKLLRAHASGRRQVPGPVDDSDLRLAEMGGQPIASDEILAGHEQRFLQPKCASIARGFKGDAHTPVDPAFLLDADDDCAADFAGARDMGSAARLEVEADDLDQPHAAGSGRRLDRHGLDQAGIGGELLVADPARAHLGVGGDQRVEARFDFGLVDDRLARIEIEPPLAVPDRAAGDRDRAGRR